MPSRPGAADRVIAHGPARQVFRFPSAVFRSVITAAAGIQGLAVHGPWTRPPGQLPVSPARVQAVRSRFTPSWRNQVTTRERMEKMYWTFQITPIAEGQIAAAGEMLARAFFNDPLCVYAQPDPAARLSQFGWLSAGSSGRARASRAPMSARLSASPMASPYGPLLRPASPP